MISLVLPYWMRQQAANKALALLAATYAGMPLEVVVVDDGSPERFVPPVVDLNLRVIRLPEKPVPGAISATINAGVAAASHEVVAISAVEILHERPVLRQMLAELDWLGPMGYVLAAAWCPEQKMWHCHTTRRLDDCPPGTGQAFCGMLHKSLYRLAGGFDEDYCAGAGWEDRDFIWRLHKVGARFVIRDDLVVIHPKAGARIAWDAARMERNRGIFERKWAC